MHQNALYSSVLLAICDSRTRRAAITTPRRHAVGKKRRETRGRFDRSYYPWPRHTLNETGRYPFAGNKVLMVATSTLILPKVVNEISKTSCFSSFRIRPYIGLSKSIRTSIYILATHYDSRSTERLSIVTRAVFTLIYLLLNLYGEIRFKGCYAKKLKTTVDLNFDARIFMYLPKCSFM